MHSAALRARSTVALGLLLGLLTGCGETNIHAIQRLRPAFSHHRVDLATLARSLPPPGALREPRLPERMDPAPSFFERETNDPRANTEILFVDEIFEREPDPTLSIRSPLSFCLDWTGPHNPLSPEVWDRRGHLGEECESAMRRPWIVLLRNVEQHLPTVMRMEAFVFHGPSQRMVGALPIVVTGRFTDADLGRGPWAERAMGEVASAFHQAASCELSMQLSRLPGASFEFDGRGCEGSFREIATPASLSGAFVATEAKPVHRDENVKGVTE